MFSAGAFRELVSGRRRGAWAGLLRGLLRLAEYPYTAIVQWRNRRFDSGRIHPQRVDVPVISVGNLSMGGTGKTPTVEWIARWLTERGVSVVLISRGYKSSSAGGNDEARELADRLPNVPHLQDADRLRAAAQAIAEHHPQVLLLDDAFQHRRIARDLDIVLLDATEPFGFDHVFPRGTLREPAPNLARADVVLLTRADAVSPERRAAIHHRVATLAPEAAWAEATHAPHHLLDCQGNTHPLTTLSNAPVAAFCGIGNPAGFRHTLDAAGLEVHAFREFPDHHAYTASDIASLTQWAESLPVKAILCTHKDLVKLDPTRSTVDHLANRPLYALVIQLEISLGQKALESRVGRVENPAMDATVD